jgi:hypothetical protein
LINIAWVGHGNDGFGNRGHNEDELKIEISKEHAANALIRLTNEHDDVHLIALGI